MTQLHLGKDRVSARKASHPLERVTWPAAAAVLFASAAAWAVPRTWAPTTGGDFNTAANWSPDDAAPNTSDVAIFSNNAAQTISFSSDATVNQLDFRHTAGALTLDLGGNTLALTNNNGLWLRNSAIQVNDVTFTNGAIHTSLNTLRLADAANMKDNVFTITGANTLLLSDHPSTGASAVGNAAGADNNVFNIEDGATLTANNTFRIGAIEATARTNAMNVTNATVNFTAGNRPLILQNGSFNVTNSTVTIASAIDAAAAGNHGFINFNSGALSVRQTLINNGQTFFIGDGGAIDADFRMVGGNAVITAANGVHVRSNGSLGGAGVITGNVAGDAGARFGVTTGAPTEPTATTVNGNFDAGNFTSITLRLGDFPDELADIQEANDLGEDPPLVFAPPADSLLVNGLFTHAASVVIDLAGYVAPQDMDYDMRLIGWTAVAGTAAPVSFINGSPLAYEYRDDGLYVVAAVVPEPASLVLLAAGFGAMRIGRRRPRR